MYFEAKIPKIGLKYEKGFLKINQRITLEDKFMYRAQFIHKTIQSASQLHHITRRQIKFKNKLNSIQFEDLFIVMQKKSVSRNQLVIFKLHFQSNGCQKCFVVGMHRGTVC